MISEGALSASESSRLHLCPLVCSLGAALGGDCLFFFRELLAAPVLFRLAGVLDLVPASPLESSFKKCPSLSLIGDIARLALVFVRWTDV